MPIYEFFCPDCHTVYSFFSSTVRTGASPACPKCGRQDLGRRPSRFAAIRRTSEKGGGEGDADGGDTLAGVDDQRLEGALESLAGEMESMGEGGEDDPRQMARFFRRFGELAGLEAGPKMEDMIRRLEAGEDPESLEELGESEGGDDEGGQGGGLEDYFQAKKKLLAARRRPRVDDTLYFFD